MRPDFARILVERPRLGGGWLRRARLESDVEVMPKGQSHRRAVLARGHGKHLNDNLRPLRRHLEKQVGRPWNKVYGEIRARIPPGHAAQDHVLIHVLDMVDLHVRIVPPSAEAPCGVVHHVARIARRQGLWPGDLYVHPVSGLLRRARRRLKGPPSPGFGGRLGRL